MKRFDIRASIHEIKGKGSDGAYDLIGDNQTAEEFAKTLVEVLNSDWGLTKSDGPFRLEINIADAGQGDNLPL